MITDNTTATAKRTTWRELLPPGMPEPPLVTREELLATFQDEQVPITERTLRFWEAEGVLPRAIRQWHHGAVRTLYPRWFDIIIATVGARRDQGEPLKQIAADIPRIVKFIASLSWMADNRVFPLPSQIASAIEPLVLQQQQAWQTPIARVVITLQDQNGCPVSSYVHLYPGDGPTDSTKPRNI